MSVRAPLYLSLLAASNLAYLAEQSLHGPRFGETDTEQLVDDLRNLPCTVVRGEAYIELSAALSILRSAESTSPTLKSNLGLVWLSMKFHDEARNITVEPSTGADQALHRDSISSNSEQRITEVPSTELRSLSHDSC